LRVEIRTEFWWGNLKERVHLEDPGLGSRKILKLKFRKWDEECMACIDLAQGRDRWRSLVNTVMNLRVP